MYIHVKGGSTSPCHDQDPDAIMPYLQEVLKLQSKLLDVERKLKAARVWMSISPSKGPML